MQAAFEKAKEERVELMHRQSARRIMNAGLNNAWSAWYELWNARTYALAKLREVANRLRSPELAHAYNHWLRRVHATHESRLKQETEQKLSLLTEEGRRTAVVARLGRALERRTPFGLRRRLQFELSRDRRAIDDPTLPLELGHLTRELQVHRLEC